MVQVGTLDAMTGPLGSGQVAADIGLFVLVLECGFARA
jgi:hypothetical protein